MLGGRRALLGCLAGAWLAGISVLAALALGESACGPAFSIGGAASDASAGGASDVNAAVPDGGSGADSGSSDAGPLFCAAYADAHTFCEDFSDQPFPGKFDRVGANNGTVEADTMVFKSPPESALAVTPVLAAGASGSALLTHPFTASDGLGLHYTLTDAVRLESDCFPSATQGVAIASIYFPNSVSHYAIDILALTGNVEIVESTSADGGPGTVTPHFVDVGTLGLDDFTTWTVDIHVAQKTTTVTVGGTLGATQTLTGAPSALDLTTPTLLVGASVTGASQGCHVHVDDVLFDIRAM